MVPEIRQLTNYKKRKGGLTLFQICSNRFFGKHKAETFKNLVDEMLAA